MKTKLQILTEAFNYYSQPEMRGIVAGRCSYLTSDGKRCAVGRCLIPDSVIKDIDGENSHQSCRWGVERIKNLEDILAPEYRGHGGEFWYDLQGWHDDNDNFTKTGISDIGRDDILELMVKYQNQ
jgi:hypothetical protein